MHNASSTIARIALGLLVACAAGGASAVFAGAGQPSTAGSATVALAGGRERVTVPFKLLNSSIFIPVTVDGTGMQFVFDTGGRNLLTKQAARKLHLKAEGHLKMIPAGKNRPPTAVARVDSIVVDGKVRMRHQKILVVALPGFARTEGDELDGLVGRELLERYVVRVDYAERTLTFIEPGAFHPAGAGKAVPIVGFLGGDPLVEADLDGASGRVIVDTGSHEPLILFKPFVDAHKLESRYATTPETVIGWGFGGATPGRVARACKLTLGKVTYRDPVIELAASAHGVTGLKQVAGDLGGPVLRHYTVTFDYPDRTMYLKPVKGSSGPHAYDRSGLWVNGGKGGDFVVEGVMQGSPAAGAGIEVHDSVTAVNGKPAGALGLSAFRAMLRDSAPGTNVKLAVRGKSGARTVTLTLARLIPKAGCKVSVRSGGLGSHW